jgi:hypothetical protein
LQRELLLELVPMPCPLEEVLLPLELLEPLLLQQEQLVLQVLLMHREQPVLQAEVLLPPCPLEEVLPPLPHQVQEEVHLHRQEEHHHLLEVEENLLLRLQSLECRQD